MYYGENSRSLQVAKALIRILNTKEWILNSKNEYLDRGEEDQRELDIQRRLEEFKLEKKSSGPPH